jgi:hypothetical protein
VRRPGLYTVGISQSVGGSEKVQLLPDQKAAR